MQERARTISAAEVLEKAEAVAKEAFRRRLPDFDVPEFEVGIFPDHGTCGIICPEFELARASGKDLLATAAHITDGLGDLARGSRPSIGIFDNILIFGFRPIDPVVFGGLR